MNNAKIATLLRQLAAEFDVDTGQEVPRGLNPRTPTRTEGILKDELPEESWKDFDIMMRFGKYSGESLLEVPTEYLEYLGRENFVGRGDDLGNAIEAAIRFLANPRTLKPPTELELPKEPKKKSKLVPQALPFDDEFEDEFDDDLDEDVPF